MCYNSLNGGKIMNFYKTNCKGIENEIKFAQVLDNKMIKDFLKISMNMIM